MPLAMRATILLAIPVALTCTRASAQQLDLGVQRLPVTSPEFVKGASVAADLDRVALVDERYTIHVWSLRQNREIRAIPGVWPANLAAVKAGIVPALSPDGRMVAYGGTDGVLRVWDVATGALRHSLAHTPPDPPVVRMLGDTVRRPLGTYVGAWAFDPAGRRIASAGGGLVVVWDLASGAPLWRAWQYATEGGGIGDVAFSPAGDVLATAGGDGGVRFWSARDGAPLPGLDAVAHWNHLRFGADGATLVLAGYRGSGNQTRGVVQVWSARTRTLVREVGFERFATFAELSPDGRHVAAGYETFHIWDVATGRMVFELPPSWRAPGPGTLLGMRAARFSRDGTTILTVHGGKQPLTLWSTTRTDHESTRVVPLPRKR